MSRQRTCCRLFGSYLDGQLSLYKVNERVELQEVVVSGLQWQFPLGASESLSRLRNTMRYVRDPCFSLICLIRIEQSDLVTWMTPAVLQ